MKELKFIVLLFFLIMITARCDYSEGFRFHNNSTSDVYIDLDLYGGILYPDTAISKTKRGALYKAGDTFYYTINTAKESILNQHGTVSLFIFDADTFNIYSWEEIRNGYKILQRYDISVEDFKALRYNISYPPTEAMKNMKMYPPYEQ